MKTSKDSICQIPKVSILSHDFIRHRITLCIFSMVRSLSCRQGSYGIIGSFISIKTHLRSLILKVILRPFIPISGFRVGMHTYYDVLGTLRMRF